MSSSSSNNVRDLPESSHYQPPLPPTQSTISKPLPLLNDFLITPPKHQPQQQQSSLPTLDSKLFDLPSPNTNVPIIIPSSSTSSNDYPSPSLSTQPPSLSSLPTTKQSISSSDKLDTLNEPIYDTIVSTLYHHP